MKHRANVYRIDGVEWVYRAPRVEWEWMLIRVLIYFGLIPLCALGVGWFWVCVMVEWCH